MSDTIFESSKIDVSQFTCITDAQKFILASKLEVEDISNQINDYVELMTISKKIESELDVDPNWIIKAQYARRIKLNNILSAQEWINLNNQSKPVIPDLSLNQHSLTELKNEISSINRKLNSINLSLESNKNEIKKERIKRSNSFARLQNQTGFLMRAVRELFLYFTRQLTETPCQTSLLWVDEILSKSPDSLQLKRYDSN